MADDKSELIARAERGIVDAVEEWGKTKPWTYRELSELEKKLRAALYDLERARRVTGQISVAKKDP